jgi:hypothetical protein
MGSSTGALSTVRLQIQDDGDRKAGVYEVKDVKKEDRGVGVREKSNTAMQEGCRVKEAQQRIYRLAALHSS